MFVINVHIVCFHEPKAFFWQFLLRYMLVEIQLNSITKTRMQRKHVRIVRLSRKKGDGHNKRISITVDPLLLHCLLYEGAENHLSRLLNDPSSLRYISPKRIQCILQSCFIEYSKIQNV